jgi:hypothetical protein
MTDMLIDSVLAAFIIGGIVGAVTALHLQAGRTPERRVDTARLMPVRVRSTRHPRRRSL